MLKLPIFILILFYLTIAEWLRRIARRFDRDAAKFDIEMKELVARASQITADYEIFRNKLH